MKSISLLAATAAIGASLVSATGTHVVRIPDAIQRRENGVQKPSTLPVPGSPTSQGCYSSGGNLTTVPVNGLSSSSCIAACTKKGKWVSALHATECLCGDAYPPEKSLEKSGSDCNYPCPLYPPEACGGLGNGKGVTYYSIFNNGIQIDVSHYEPAKSSSSKSSTSSTSSSSTSSSSASSTSGQSSATTTSQTETTTTAAEAETSSADNDKNKSSGPNVGAIAAGVVAGVVVVAAAIGGGCFYLRRKRNAEIEEEHRRNAAVNAFISGSQPPSTAGSISMTDSRLDPVMAHRRLSDGSIADNQDYSRRILRVTNA